MAEAGSGKTAEAASRESGAGDPGEIAVALGRIPSGLYVITWSDPQTGDDRAMLASWVMQAGFEPPAVSLAVAASRPLAAAIEAGRPFVVNMLAESQRSMVGRFGRPAVDGYDPFDGLAPERSPSGAAILAPATGWLECVGLSAAMAGDHRVVVATVRAAGGSASVPASPGGEPIVHLRRNGLRY